MRIVAGTARGRSIEGPKGPGIRPTADRVRESVFNILGQYLDGGRVLDLFAGTGALALEALSRGAQSAVLVDRSKEAIELCRGNAAALGFAEQVRILPAPVNAATLSRVAEWGPFGLVFADPPYDAIEPQALLELLGAAGILAAGATVVIEHDKRRASPERAPGFVRRDQRIFGDTAVSFYAPEGDPSET